MASFFILIAGVVAAFVVSVVIAFVMETVLDLFSSNTDVGGHGACMLIPFGVVASIPSAFYGGIFTDVTGWALFMYPVWGAIIIIAVLNLIGLYASALMKD